jgi:predicted YcjX-like family ATPase
MPKNVIITFFIQHLIEIKMTHQFTLFLDVTKQVCLVVYFTPNNDLKLVRIEWTQFLSVQSVHNVTYGWSHSNCDILFIALSF